MLLNKPPSMGLREWLIKRVGIEQHLPNTIVTKIVQHQYESAHKALKTNNSIEIAGFGKFFYNVKKAETQMEKCLSQKQAYQKILDEPSITEKKRHSYEQRMITVENGIKALTDKKKFYEEE